MMHGVTLLAVLWAAAQDAPSPQEEHRETCPASCETCDKAAQRAVEFIAAAQQKDGSWRIRKQGEAEGNIGWDDIAITSLNALALCAAGSTPREGPHRERIQTARDRIVQVLKQGVIVPKGMEKSAECRRELVTPVAAWFLCQDYAATKSDDLKGVLENLRNGMIQWQLEEGGWNYQRTITKKKLVRGMPFQTCMTVLALTMLRAVDIQVGEGVFQKAARSLESGQNEDGGYPYYSAMRALPSEPGRTAAALLAMQLLGMRESDSFQRAKKCLKERMEQVAGSQHGPGFHVFLTAMSTRAIDPALWKEFWDSHRSRILAGQAGDGSILMTPPQGANAPIDDSSRSPISGPVYTTPLYAMVLLMPKTPALFGDLNSVNK